MDYSFAKEGKRITSSSCLHGLRESQEGDMWGHTQGKWGTAGSKWARV